MTTATLPRRRGQRLQIAPRREIGFTLLLSEDERDELDRKALAAQCTSAAEFIRRQIIGGESRAVTPPAA